MCGHQSVIPRLLVELAGSVVRPFVLAISRIHQSRVHPVDPDLLAEEVVEV